LTVAALICGKREPIRGESSYVGSWLTAFGESPEQLGYAEECCALYCGLRPYLGGLGLGPATALAAAPPRPANRQGGPGEKGRREEKRREEKGRGSQRRRKESDQRAGEKTRGQG